MLKIWGADRPDNTLWNSNQPVQESCCRSIPSYSTPESGDAETCSCKLGAAFTAAVQSSLGGRGRVRGDWKGNHGGSPSCLSSGRGNYHCTFQQHGFGSGECRVDNSQSFSQNGVCDCCTGDSSRNPFDRGSCTSGGCVGSNCFGWQCRNGGSMITGCEAGGIQTRTAGSAFLLDE